MEFRIMTRSIDHDCGEQVVLLIDDVVAGQWIYATRGNHWYTEDGNPEWIGKRKSELRGTGLRTVPEPKDTYGAHEYWERVNKLKSQIAFLSTANAE